MSFVAPMLKMLTQSQANMKALKNYLNLLLNKMLLPNVIKACRATISI